MKQIALLLTLFLSFSSCGQTLENEIESILHDCLVKSYKAEQVNIKQELDELEKYLISSKSLKSSAGQSYFDFYKEIADLNDIPTTLDHDRFENIYKLTPNKFYSIDCLEKLKRADSSTIADSKYSQMTLAIQNAAQNEVSPSSIAKAIISVLGPSDFDNQYYRAVALLTIAYTANSEVGIQRQLETNENEDNAEYESISVTLTEKDQIILNRNEISQEELKIALAEFIKANGSNHEINLRADKAASYDFYLKIQDQIVLVYNELRNELAMTKYDQTFNELTGNQQNEIKRIFPKRIKIFVGQNAQSLWRVNGCLQSFRSLA
ncbi:ExbD/TolR family protein [Algoriphagus hitonicola]|uniref:Biopolymer transport protein ExbD/TolR n=1 Tax=Algoriphagus hitonicola TaxID=435880 RepID=A0A1I2P4Q2_9BACT|nr:biopolymer transporter ExbD [Algoriphagus hitonicola]SFG11024.1 Biopolymer transport protein ExbD/TolR [Algoriphagus hitonicola]